MVRSWVRQALRASGVAILVPAAVAAAIALSVLGGGPRVGSLSEVLRGPAVPPAETLRAGGRFARPRARPAGRSRRLHTRAAADRRTEVPVRRPAARRPAVPAPRPPASSAPAPAPVARPPAPPAPSRPPPAPPAHPIQDTGAAVAEAARPLPLAGPAAAAAVEAVVSLVDPA